MLVDTDVLIWHLRGYAQATRKLDQVDALALSAVSYMELLQGMRDKTELVPVKRVAGYRCTKVKEICVSYRDNFFLTHFPRRLAGTNFDGETSFVRGINEIWMTSNRFQPKCLNKISRS